MADSYLDFVEKFITDFSWRRILVYFVVLLVILVAVLTFEQYTSHFQLGKLERTAALLKESVELSHTVKTDSTLQPIYDEIIKELNDVVHSKPIGQAIPAIVWKGLAGAAPWLLVTLSFVPKIRRGEANRGILTGALLFVVSFGIIGMILPESWGPSVHYLIYPIGHFVLIGTIMMLWQARKRRAS